LQHSTQAKWARCSDEETEKTCALKRKVSKEVMFSENFNSAQAKIY